MSRHNKRQIKPLYLGDAGGGGERVLWTAIRATLDDKTRSTPIHCILYTGDDVSTSEMLDKVSARFNISIPAAAVTLVRLKMRWLVEAETYPRLTLLGQSIGSVFLCLEALLSFPPDVFLDTMGYAFTYPLVKLLLPGCPIVSYTHYPTISTDMLNKVASRTEAHNNDAVISRNPLLSQAKLVYYRVFANMYGFVGRRADVVMVNSTWTANHIKHLWHMPSKTFLVYPPCDTMALAQLPIRAAAATPTHTRAAKMISVAQFRPEKNHRLQLEAFAALLDKHPRFRAEKVQLALLGSSRNAADEARIAEYRSLAKQLNIEDQVLFVINASYDELKMQLGSALIGLHTMWNEHFGIGIVEYMAAGLIPLAHNSGGPRMDIVVAHNGQPTGFLASTVDEYVEAMDQILSMSADEQAALQENARSSVAQRFSEQAFQEAWTRLVTPLLQN
ncbi:asparagine-linked glycosylation protein [Sorochytrium milnesiophthora]